MLFPRGLPRAAQSRLGLVCERERERDREGVEGGGGERVTGKVESEGKSIQVAERDVCTLSVVRMPPPPLSLRNIRIRRYMFTNTSEYAAARGESIESSLLSVRVYKERNESPPPHVSVCGKIQSDTFHRPLYLTTP